MDIFIALYVLNISLMYLHNCKFDFCFYIEKTKIISIIKKNNRESVSVAFQRVSVGSQRVNVNYFTNSKLINSCVCCNNFEKQIQPG